MPRTRRDREFLLACLAIGAALASAVCSIDRRPPSEGRATGESAGPWLGEVAPDSVARIFAPGLVSTGDEERDAAWSPDGREFYYTLAGPRPTLVRIRMEGNRWGRPEVAPFSGRYSDLEPAFSADGNRLYFSSNRPIESGGEPKDDFDLWVVARVAGVWGSPENLGDPINTAGNEFFPSLAGDGTLIWTAEREGGLGDEDIWIARPNGEGFTDPRPLPDAINTPGPEFNACITRDGTSIVFGGYGRPDGYGGGDIYASHRAPDGSWSAARNLGPVVNTAGLDYCPSITPDGRYLFFSRRGRGDPFPARRLEYEELKGFLDGAGNGRGDIFWVPASVLAP